LLNINGLRPAQNFLGKGGFFSKGKRQIRRKNIIPAPWQSYNTAFYHFTGLLNESQGNYVQKNKGCEHSDSQPFIAV